MKSIEERITSVALGIERAESFLNECSKTLKGARPEVFSISREERVVTYLEKAIQELDEARRKFRGDCGYDN